MCVGAQRPRAPPSALLLLGLALGSAAKLTCPGDAYPRGSKCCQDCPPGFGMESRCTQTEDTRCSKCESGHYNEATNYEPCKPCTQCNQREPPNHRQAAPGPQPQPQTPNHSRCSAGGPRAPPSSQGRRPRGAACAGHVARGSPGGWMRWAGSQVATGLAPRGQAGHSVQGPRGWGPQGGGGPCLPHWSCSCTTSSGGRPPPPLFSGGRGRGPHIRPLLCPGGHSCRKPIQEEHSDAHSTLAKL
ncbi:PREDICTED: tumor necrosis factor receptor superfamily member 4 [Myotis davidii]|uniref:tumor necrosis factor receptor superfamily member 4 n=1 Tax=Myotis davidii TaxID=225400 RepID=UPI0007672DA8|nr:PREDICTED: tumor necrosis factor receptor superfamily member 4 [Myotis davidii]